MVSMPWLAALLLLCACILAYGSATRGRYQFASGESMQFMGESCGFEYYPSKSANCTECFLFFKLGALTEQDAYGQPITAHMLPDMSKMTPEVASGRRVSGNAQFEYVTMTFSGQPLASMLTDQACPTLESILSQAQQMAITQDQPVPGLSLVPSAALAMNPTLVSTNMAVTGAESAAPVQAVIPSNSANAGSNSRRLASAAAVASGPAYTLADLITASVSATSANQTRSRTAAPPPTAAAALQPLPAAAAAAVAPTVAPSIMPLPLAASAFTDPSSTPYLKITFMFGFTAKKAIPYGKDYVISSPVGSIRWTLEAKNWPFCSPYNSLKLELVTVSSLKDNQAQFVVDSAGRWQVVSAVYKSQQYRLVLSTADYSGESALSVNEQIQPVPAVRKLQFATQFSENYGASFFDPEQPEVTKRAAAGLPVGPLAGLTPGQPLDPLATLGLMQDVLPTRKLDNAKLLVGPGLAAAIELPTYSFSSSNLTGLSNVTTVLASNNTDGAARFILTFGYFTTGLYYDSIIYFDSPLNMDIALEPLLPAGGALGAANCSSGDVECNSRGGRRKGTSNAAGSTSNGVLGQIGSLLLAMLFVCLLQ